MAEHLSTVFFDKGEWAVNNSQHPFDIYSLGCKVAIELKSFKYKYNNKYFVSNATIYPHEARIRDVVPKNRWEDSWTDAYLDTMLDVAIVFVNKVDGKINNFYITDGSYWGIDLEDYLSCREFFNIINNPTMFGKILNVINEEYPNQTFVSKLINNGYDKKIKLCFRKLISCSSPLIGG